MDIVSRFEIRNVDFLNRPIRYLADETGNLVSARGIGNFLKSQNVSISVTAILNYLNYLTTAMLIAGVQRSDIHGKKVFEVEEKYYFNDIGLRNSIAGFSPFDLGQIIENVVYLHLKSLGYDVLSGKQQDKEIDCIARQQGGYYGIFSVRDRKKNIEKARDLLGEEARNEKQEALEDGARAWEKLDTVWNEILEAIKNNHKPNCPVCKKGRMHFAGMAHDAPLDP